jgi:hypothetical protein
MGKGKMGRKGGGRGMGKGIMGVGDRRGSKSKEGGDSLLDGKTVTNGVWFWRLEGPDFAAVR